MTLCITCLARGDRTEATHRLVARGKAEEKSAAGHAVHIYADITACAVCEEHKLEIMSAPIRRQARLLINVISELQRSANGDNRGLTFQPSGKFGGDFDWGFADLDKPLFVVTAEFENPALRMERRQKPPPERVA